MNKFDRWKDFALRMARTCYTNHNDPSHPTADWIAEQVEDFMEYYLDKESRDYYVDWDHSERFPRGHTYYSRRRRTWCWDCKGAGCDKSYCEDGWVYDYNSADFVCDLFSCWTDHIFYQWTDYASNEDIHWFEIHERVFDTDWSNNAIREEVVERWTGPVACCVRAGMDFAYSPSAGVLGFTAGDLRRMFPEGVPDWVKGDELWTGQTFSGVIPGVGFTLGEEMEGVPFDEIPDEQGVWL